MSELANRKERKQFRTLILLAVLCLCFANVAYAQGKCQYNDTDVDMMNGKIVLNSTRQPINGVFCLYHHNGKVSSEVPLKGGNIEGIARDYYENGKLELETPIKDGKREGTQKHYYENGNLESETSYKNDNREGYEQRYIESGRLWGRVLYKNGEIVSGTCENGRAFTNAEIISWKSGRTVFCTLQK